MSYSRVMSDMSLFKKIHQPLVLPFDRLPANQKEFKKLKILNYGLEVQAGKFSFGEKSSITLIR